MYRNENVIFNSFNSPASELNFSVATNKLEDGNENKSQPPRIDFSIAAWNSSLTNRHRVLLHTFPLQDLRSGDTRVDQELRHYDSLALAMKIIDLIIDGTGLEDETDREKIENVLAPLLHAMDAQASVPIKTQRHRQIIDRVLGGLRNDQERRRPFSKTYIDFNDNGEAVLRKLEFRLVVDYHHPNGSTVLRLSNEAINLFLNAFELDIEDAQTAAEAVLQSQLERGRFDEAVQSARNARFQSLRFAEKLTNIIRNTRQDVSSVDWWEHTPQLLNEALSHIELRLDSEENILKATEDRLNNMELDEQQTRVLTEVRQLIQDCRLRHTDLQPLLMTSRNTFLDEQARQSFRLEFSLPMPHMLADILNPLLSFKRKEALPIVESSFSCFLGASPPPILSLVDIIHWHLRPRRAKQAAYLPVNVPDLTASASDLLRFPTAVHKEVREIIEELEERTVLSSLLERLIYEEYPLEVIELLLLYFLHAYAPDMEAQLSFRVEKLIGKKLRTRYYCGDDMMLFWK